MAFLGGGEPAVLVHSPQVPLPYSPAVPTNDRPAKHRSGLPLGLRLCLLGMFTLSWDRLLVIHVSTYRLHLSVVSFALAWGLQLATVRSQGQRIRRARLGPAIQVWAIVILFTIVVNALISDSPRFGLSQTIVYVLSALIPFFAILSYLRNQSDLESLLLALVYGALIASLYGAYQLFAFYSGLPQGLVYQGISGGIGRIAAFSYEPAFFSDFVLVALAATIALNELRTVRWYRWAILLFLTTLIVANSRAVYLYLPLFLLLVWRRLGSEALSWAVKRLLGLFVGILVSLTLLGAHPWQPLIHQLGSIGNPQQASSNAVRLQQYRAEVTIIKNYWGHGIGPGNLIDYAPVYGIPVAAGAGPNDVVANNIWLQSLLDGGLPLAFLEGVFVWLVVASVMKGQRGPVRTIGAVWLALVIVAGSLTSVFFDIKLWASLALALGATSLAADISRPIARVPQATRPHMPVS